MKRVKKSRKHNMMSLKYELVMVCNDEKKEILNMNNITSDKELVILIYTCPIDTKSSFS
jgi:hypothetical protein